MLFYFVNMGYANMVNKWTVGLLAIGLMSVSIGGLLKSARLSIHDNEIKMLIKRVEALEQQTH